MASARTVRPTDIVALVSYDGRVCPNEAVTRDRTGSEGSPHPLEAALEQWLSFATGRHTWISVKGATLRGLVSARRRGSKAAWELDTLIDAADEPEVIISLLEQAVVDAGRAGAEKLFLRVPSYSDVIRQATTSGFVPYMTERLLVAQQSDIELRGDGDEGLRRWARADAYPTFRLYNRWAPERVRRVEAPTFREWLAASERLAARGTQRVIEHESRLAGWLRAAADGELGRFDVMTDPDAPDLLERMIESALARLREQSTVLCLVPEYAAELAGRLERRGFRPRAEYTVLARRTTKEIELAELATAAPAPTTPA